MSQKRITIRPLRLTDADDIHELMHMPNVLWGTTLLPSTSAAAWHKTLEDWMQDVHRYIFVADLQNKVAGIVNLHVGTGRERHVGTIAMAVHDTYQGQGIGKMLMLTVIDLADNWLNLVRLEMDVYTDNERALRLYKNFDFEIEGRKRLDAFRAGRYSDRYILARLRLFGTGLQQGEQNTQLNITASFARVPESPSGMAEAVDANDASVTNRE